MITELFQSNMEQTNFTISISKLGDVHYIWGNTIKCTFRMIVGRFCFVPFFMSYTKNFAKQENGNLIV